MEVKSKRRRRLGGKRAGRYVLDVHTGRYCQTRGASRVNQVTERPRISQLMQASSRRKEEHDKRPELEQPFTFMGSREVVELGRAK